jgi:hypothetical protein
VVSDVLEPGDADEAPCVRAGSAAHARDEEVAAGQAAELRARRLRHRRQLRPRDDGCEDAVDVEHDRAPLRRLDERRDGGADVHGS